MSQPRLRFTVRRMMVAIVVLAVAMAIVAGLQRRRALFQRRAAEYRQKVSDTLWKAQCVRVNNRWTFDPRTDAAYFELAEHFVAMQVKYEQAAARPWRVVSPDRPEPDWPKDVARE